MRNVIVICTLLLICGIAQGRESSPHIKNIAKTFLVTRGLMASDTDVSDRNIAFVVYDYTNNINVSEQDTIPLQNDLICYYISTLSPHGKGYVMLVKNGVYEIIDMDTILENIMEQTILYCRKNNITNLELLSAIEYILLQYKNNVQNTGGVSISK